MANRRAHFDATVDKARRRWLFTESHRFIHYEIDEGTAEAGEGKLDGWGDSHVLSIVDNGKRSKIMSIALSEMTEEELDELQKFLNIVIDRARPVTQLRDRKAREAFDAGNDGFYRLYRAVPRYIERKRKGGEHDKGDTE